MDQATLHTMSGNVVITCCAMLFALWLGHSVTQLKVPKIALVPICVICWCALYAAGVVLVRSLWMK